MKILNFGSLNIDHVYSVDHIVHPGETTASTNYQVLPGGKGLNQSIALSKAGINVYHAGMIGEDGVMLIKLCDDSGINRENVITLPVATGHAIIQVGSDGQNSIVVHGGANRHNTKEFIDKVLSNFGEGDILLLQNEINLVDYIIQKAHTKKMIIVLNPSPYEDSIKLWDLNKISYIIMNEVEGEQITGEKNTESILCSMKSRYPDVKVVLTLGKDGAVYQDDELYLEHSAYNVSAIDTTAAGDTFTGYFISSVIDGLPVAEGLKLASKASAVAVTIKGAANSIPKKEEITDFTFK